MTRSASPASRGRWIAIVLIVTGAAVAGFYGWRMWNQWHFDARVARGEVQVEALRGWMTLDYVARRFGVPESQLREAIGAPPTGHPERSLHQWFEALGLDPLQGRRAIEQRIRQGAATPASGAPP